MAFSLMLPAAELIVQVGVVPIWNSLSATFVAASGQSMFHLLNSLEAGRLMTTVVPASRAYIFLYQGVSPNGGTILRNMKH
jgi:hypothetical protein